MQHAICTLSITTVAVTEHCLPVAQCLATPAERLGGDVYVYRLCKAIGQEACQDQKGAEVGNATGDLLPGGCDQSALKASG